MKESSNSYTVYVIQVTPGLKTWTIERRFNDFVYLHKEISKFNPNISMPNLPKKKFFGSSLDAKFVEERRVDLEVYLQKLATIGLFYVYILAIQTLIYF